MVQLNCLQLMPLLSTFRLINSHLALLQLDCPTPFSLIVAMEQAYLQLAALHSQLWRFHNHLAFL